MAVSIVAAWGDWLRQALSRSRKVGTRTAFLRGVCRGDGGGAGRGAPRGRGPRGEPRAGTEWAPWCKKL